METTLIIIIVIIIIIVVVTTITQRYSCALSGTLTETSTISHAYGADWVRTGNGIDPRSNVEDTVNDTLKRNHEEMP
eukprot:5105868-Pyramimonas_sp.AAC.1